MIAGRLHTTGAPAVIRLSSAMGAGSSGSKTRTPKRYHYSSLLFFT
jgi:hypothetical protein